MTLPLPPNVSAFFQSSVKVLGQSSPRDKDRLHSLKQMENPVPSPLRFTTQQVRELMMQGLHHVTVQQARASRPPDTDPIPRTSNAEAAGPPSASRLKDVCPSSEELQQTAGQLLCPRDRGKRTQDLDT